MTMPLTAATDNPQNNPLNTLSDAQLLDEVQQRACRFFIEQAEPRTGLVSDRARLDGSGDNVVASLASTGYALGALPIAVEHGWLSRDAARQQAERTLQFAWQGLAQEHGWFYRFVDKRTGQRTWESELSSIDTALFVAGARVCAQYFEVDSKIRVLSNDIYSRLDWTWMRTNGGAQPNKLVLSHGWSPEGGFLRWDWGAYSEGTLLYLLGLGADKNGLPKESWDAWKRGTFKYGQAEALDCGPIFTHQMVHGFFPLKDHRDRLGFDYWTSGKNATLIQRQYCIDNPTKRKTYAPDIWGLNASDGPGCYKAYGVPGPEDGTVCPTGALASIIFTPEFSVAAGLEMHRRYGDRIWGRYGFADSFNVDADWFGKDVIGIDLGMATLAIENHRTRLIWRLMEADPLLSRAYAAAEIRPTKEEGNRALLVEPKTFRAKMEKVVPLELGVQLPLLKQ